jgi:acetyl-CoA synthetase
LIHNPVLARALVLIDNGLTLSFRSMSKSPEQSTMSQMSWEPSPELIAKSNIAWLMRSTGVESYEALHAWSVRHRSEYWKLAIERLGICFEQPFSRVLEQSDRVENSRWLVDAQLNIVQSCFAAPPDSPAIIYQAENGPLAVLSVGQLKTLTARVASNLKRRGFRPGDTLAILMPMTAESVAIYLGIIQAGCVAVGIADSFQPKEIATRLRLAQVVGLFSQDFLRRGGKSLPLYAKAIEAGAPPAIVVRTTDKLDLSLRQEDCTWADFLQTPPSSELVIREPSDALTILFSSGTTGEPKAIPWTQTTPIKCAADAQFHHDVQPGDVLVWPTNLGWMMGPWLVFASLLNRATMGLYYGPPTGTGFGRFVEQAKATMLGVVPSLVRAWHSTDCLRGVDWHRIKVFSSTGECSQPDDMRWLMSLAGGRPVIEYCGGTEIGGAYITGTVTRPCVAGTFNTPALGLNLLILNEGGQPAEKGEAFLVPPSIGLSTSLLNQDHLHVYFEDVPRGPRGEVLRRRVIRWRSCRGAIGVPLAEPMTR